MKTQERIGSSRRLTTAGRMYGFLIRLNPLKARSSCLRQGMEGPAPEHLLGGALGHLAPGTSSVPPSSEGASVGPLEPPRRRWLLGASTDGVSPALP
jgi:hypothetical protein